MITVKVLEPDSTQAEIDSLNETIGFLRDALVCGDPTGNIIRLLRKFEDALATVESRPHRGLVDYDPRVHGLG